MTQRLEGKVTIVTGAGSGIGEAAAKRYAAEGAAVLVADINAAGAERVAGEITASGGRAQPFAVDVADETGTEAMARAALDAWGAIDALYANAGIGSSDTALNSERAAWDRAIGVNLTGAWLCTKAVLPTMIEARRGSVILQSSAAGIVGMRGMAAYAAAKSGLIGLAQQLVADYSEFNVRFNVIAPGTFVTPLVQSTYEERVAQGRYASVAEGLEISGRIYPLGRFGDLPEIAALALFLASDESTFITGVTIPIDGGLSKVRELVPTVASPAG